MAPPKHLFKAFIFAVTVSACGPQPDPIRLNVRTQVPLDSFRNPGLGFPRLGGCESEPIRGTLAEGNPSSILNSDLLRLIVKGNDDQERFGPGPTSTDISLNMGIGWHGVSEGGNVVYSPFIDRGNDASFSISFRYRIDAAHVVMQMEQWCNRACTDTYTLAGFAGISQPLIVSDSRTGLSYQIRHGEYNPDITYCRGWCIEGRINRGSELELQIQSTTDPTDRWDIHFPLARDDPFSRRQCREFLSANVCVRMQGYDTNLHQVQVQVAIGTNCTRREF